MTGSIYNIGFIYFLLRNIYKLKKIKKYYLHAICTYTHAYIHKKHLKIAIILMSVRIIAGIWIIELVQSSVLHLIVQLCLNPVSGLLEVNLCLLLLEWVALFWHLSRQWKEILWAPFSIVLLFYFTMGAHLHPQPKCGSRLKALTHMCFRTPDPKVYSLCLQLPMNYAPSGPIYYVGSSVSVTSFSFLDFKNDYACMYLNTKWLWVWYKRKTF